MLYPSFSFSDHTAYSFFSTSGKIFGVKFLFKIVRHHIYFPPHRESLNFDLRSQRYGIKSKTRRSDSGAILKRVGRRGIDRVDTVNMTGTIKPALMHRIPLELRSYACLGESSTRMGDPWEVLVLYPSFSFSDRTVYSFFPFLTAPHIHFLARQEQYLE